MNFSFRYFATDEDFLNFNRFYFQNTPSVKNRMVLSRFAMPVLFMALGLAYGSAMAQPAIAYIVFGLIAVFWLVFFPKLHDNGLKRNIKRLKKNGKLITQNEIVLCFYDGYFTTASIDSESRINYSAVERVGGGKTAVYLFTSVNLAHLIPLRAIPPGMLDPFWSFINKKVAEAHGVHDNRPEPPPPGMPEQSLPKSPATDATEQPPPETPQDHTSTQAQDQPPE